ncbi:CO dehydrogenase accessory protein CooC (nickel insertion) [Candidatus Velamenicoccus archaeovorus]|uniref:CO dehydrogenase accessory protein CooC (Nickel insertion) n=1 Tax=Velamenicoccus archaeovorus TaxID=1930593 RepID=A0A410P574_VELA1|nr:AAA family ATPase [Candidatus Velamenicoccus archaeovorus]QAT17124.1 CO dehydrogenase accessory protein CooC (nickel insertion) [Candidatus Velamenicoccus archaeovorus]
MNDVIVIGGKGGTGKTTISALLVLDLARKAQGGVLAVDADPNSNLCDALGLKDVGTIADIVDEVAKNPESVPKNMGKDAFIEYRIHTGITESEGFDLLVMGRPEGPGCYCYINNVLRNCMAKLIDDYRYIVIDNEAGLEHFSRKTTRACSEMIVVSDTTAVGLRSAGRIFELADELGISSKRRFLFVNKVEGPKDTGSMGKDCRLDKVFFIPYDAAVSDLSAKGVSLSCLAQDSAMRQAIVKAGEVIWPKN